MEQRLEIVPKAKQETEDKVVKVQPELFQLIQQLEVPELCLEARLSIAGKLRQAFPVLLDYTLDVNASIG